MEKQKTRDEISSDYKWDLTPIYKNDNEWFKDYEIAKNEIEKIVDFKDNLLYNAKNLLNYLKYEEKTDRLLSKLYYYAHLNFDSNTLDTKYQDMVGKISDLFTKSSELSSFVEPLFMKNDYSLIEKFYIEEPLLKNYEFNLKNMFRYKEHTLNELEEEILSRLSNCFSNPEKTYEALTDTDLKFGSITNEKGEKVEFTESNYSRFIESKDRRVRKDAFNILFNKYGSLKNTIASTYAGDIEVNITNAKIRKYNSALEQSLYADNIDKEVYTNLIDTVSACLPSLYKYYDLKKEILNLDELHLYDIYVGLIDTKDKNYEFEEAKELVLKSLSILGEDYIDNLNKAFDEHWIDIYHNEGKRGGAYSSGFYDTNPYVLLNYEKKLNDVSTLAHELGHSMHTYYSCKNNPYQYSNYKIFVAEVASTVNELLLANYMLENSNDKQEKLNILNRLIELYKATIFRQTMFAEFEKTIYEERKKGIILTYEFVSNKYYSLVKKYFGPNVICDELIKYEWERIPHFYYNFYVYKYATGLSAATYIVDNILKDKNYVEKYKNFLKSGGSDYPLNELLLADVDMKDKKVIESAINRFDELVNDFKNLYKS